MCKLVFDIETNGLTRNCTKIWCLATYNLDTGEQKLFEPRDIREGVSFLLSADELIGHNIIFFDIPVLEKIYNVSFKDIKLTDTLILARLIYSDVSQYDYKYKSVPSRLIGSHSLESWGYRLGEYKGEFGKTTDWSEYSDEMGTYCLQDTVVTAKLFKWLDREAYSKQAIELEHDVAKIISKQVQTGFKFDIKSAERLYIELLTARQDIEKELSEIFPPFEDKILFVPKVNNAKRGYEKGVPIYKIKTTPFNPASRDHIARALKERYGWIPKEFTASGKAEINEEILSNLDCKEAEPLKKYLMLDKRIGQLAEGNKAWLKLVEMDGRIHGEMITNGCNTGRMRHVNPNMSQLPAVRKPYGKEMRSLWIPDDGYLIVDVDASQLELRCLAHYLYLYDKGAYVEQIVSGDVHKYNQQAFRLPEGNAGRDMAKKAIYMILYGASSKALADAFNKPESYGKKLITDFKKNLPAYTKLVDAAQAATSRGYLFGLDKRKIPIRSKHSALNALLQGAGAVIMKQAQVIAINNLSEKYRDGVDFMQLLNIHDAFTFQAKESIAEDVKQIVINSMVEAGEVLKLNCPMAGAGHIGKNYSEVH